MSSCCVANHQANELKQHSVFLSLRAKMTFNSPADHLSVIRICNECDLLYVLPKALKRRSLLTPTVGMLAANPPQPSGKGPLQPAVAV